MNRRKSFLSRVSKFFEFVYESALFAVILAVATIVAFAPIAEALDKQITITPKAFVGWCIGGVLISLILRDS